MSSGMYDPMLLESFLQAQGRERKEVVPESSVQAAASSDMEIGENGGGNGDGAVGLKKRKQRAKNWADEETDVLLRLASQTPKKLGGLGRATPYWKAICKGVKERTHEDCRRRMETLKKAYTTITKHCDLHNKSFKQLNESDFQIMKPATRFTEDWYNQIHQHCPPRPMKKKMKIEKAVGMSSAGIEERESALAVFRSGVRFLYKYWLWQLMVFTCQIMRHLSSNGKHACM